MATPSIETVSSALGVFFSPSAFLICWLNFSFRIPSFTTSMPFGWSTSVEPRNWNKESEEVIMIETYRICKNSYPIHYVHCIHYIPWLNTRYARRWGVPESEASFYFYPLWTFFFPCLQITCCFCCSESTLKGWSPSFYPWLLNWWLYTALDTIQSSGLLIRGYRRRGCLKITLLITFNMTTSYYECTDWLWWQRHDTQIQN